MPAPGVLTMRLLSASGLRAPPGWADHPAPYCHIQLGRSHVRRSTSGFGASPTWNQARASE